MRGESPKTPYLVVSHKLLWSEPKTGDDLPTLVGSRVMNVRSFFVPIAGGGTARALFGSFPGLHMLGVSHLRAANQQD